MLSITHAVTGAAIASALPNPLFAAPLILISHYLEDLTPHWDAGTGLSSGKKSSRTAFLHELPDLALAAVLVFAFFPAALPQIHNFGFIIQDFAPLWGAFLALLPDFLEAPRNFLKKEPSWLAPFNRFHQRFHHSIPRVVDGLAPQVLILVLIWLTR